MARELFGGKDWVPRIVKKGKNWFLLPWFPPELRLDRTAPHLSREERLAVASQAMMILFDIFWEGYAHCDFHSENLFWTDGKLVVTDFEVMTPYSDGQRPAFPVCYDLVGKGLESPERTGNMCYIKQHKRRVSLADALGIRLPDALKEIEGNLKAELAAQSKTFRTRDKRHTCQANKIYCSFSLPHLSVDPSEAQRDSGKRFQQFGLCEHVLRGKDVLDLGSNIGGMLFQAQNCKPRISVGVEYDSEKVRLSQKIVAYNGLDSIRFIQADIDKLSATDLPAPFGIVFCFAIEAHVKKPYRLYQLLSVVCEGTLYFEGNSTTDPKEVEYHLKKNGFSVVHHLGLSQDDCIQSNNRRPLLVAHKSDDEQDSSSLRGS